MSSRRSTRTLGSLAGALPPSRTVPVRAPDGTRLHTQVFGPEDGYPIVLAHGITCAIRVWAYQIAELATDHRVIAFDARGHGRSGTPRRGGYSLAHLASDVDAVLEATLAPGERAVIAGHSMGGMAIAAWSDQCRRSYRAGPEPPRSLVHGLVCVAPAVLRSVQEQLLVDRVRSGAYREMG